MSWNLVLLVILCNRPFELSVQHWSFVTRVYLHVLAQITLWHILYIHVLWTVSNPQSSRPPPLTPATSSHKLTVPHLRSAIHCLLLSAQRKDTARDSHMCNLEMWGTDTYGAAFDACSLFYPQGRSDGFEMHGLLTSSGWLEQCPWCRPS